MKLQLPMTINNTLFTFAHVTDAHLYDVTDSPVYLNKSPYGPTLDVITPLIESFNAAREHSIPDFVVLGGDIVDGGIPGSFDNGTSCFIMAVNSVGRGETAIKNKLFLHLPLGVGRGEGCGRSPR